MVPVRVQVRAARGPQRQKVSSHRRDPRRNTAQRRRPGAESVHEKCSASGELGRSHVLGKIEVRHAGCRQMPPESDVSVQERREYLRYAVENVLFVRQSTDENRFCAI